MLRVREKSSSSETPILSYENENIKVSDENIRVADENIRVADEKTGVFNEAACGVSDELGSPIGLR